MTRKIDSGKVSDMSADNLLERCYKSLDREYESLRVALSPLLRTHRNRIERALSRLEVRSARRSRNGDAGELPTKHSWEAR